MNDKTGLSQDDFKKFLYASRPPHSNPIEDDDDTSNFSNPMAPLKIPKSNDRSFQSSQNLYRAPEKREQEKFPVSDTLQKLVKDIEKPISGLDWNLLRQERAKINPQTSVVVPSVGKEAAKINQSKSKLALVVENFIDLKRERNETKNYSDTHNKVDRTSFIFNLDSSAAPISRLAQSSKVPMVYSLVPFTERAAFNSLKAKIVDSMAQAKVHETQSLENVAPAFEDLNEDIFDNAGEYKFSEVSDLLVRKDQSKSLEQSSSKIDAKASQILFDALKEDVHEYDEYYPENVELSRFDGREDSDEDEEVSGKLKSQKRKQKFNQEFQKVSKIYNEKFKKT